MDDLLKYVKVDETQAKKDLKEVNGEIADLESQLDDLQQRKTLLERVVAMAAGDIDVGSLTKPTKRTRKAATKSQSVDPEKVIDFIGKNDGKATMDELKDALGVNDGRVIGGALRKDDRLTKDKDGNYVVA